MCRPNRLPVIAEALNISNAEVHGVVTFYHDYRNHPAGRHVLKLCRAEACQSMGGDAIAAKLQQLLGIGFHETTQDGSVTLEPVYCLGLCACAPAAMLDGEVIGRLDADKARRDRRSEVRAMTVDHLYPRAIPARWRSARRKSPRRSRRRLPRAGSTQRSCATARAASIGWSRWSRSRRRSGRVAYGPVSAKDVPSLFDAGLVSGGDAHAVARRPRRNSLPGQADAPDLRALRHHRSAVARRLQGAWRAEGPGEGRGDDAGRYRQDGHRFRPARPRRRGFPTGIKWKTVLDTVADRKYIVCNADEGDSGTFADRMIMEGDPFVLIEGMAIAGIATGATKGFVYIRSEYPHAVATMTRAVEIAAQDRRARRQRARLAQRLRHRDPRRRGRLCLRRGNLAAEFAGRQARRRARQAAAAGASRACSASRPSSTT